MNSTTTRIATALAGAAAIIGAGWGAATASQPAVDSCAVAVRHADHMAELHPKIVQQMASMSVAIDQGRDAKADRISHEMLANMSTYTDAQTMYRAAAANCR